MHHFLSKLIAPKVCANSGVTTPSIQDRNPVSAGTANPAHIIRTPLFINLRIYD